MSGTTGNSATAASFGIVSLKWGNQNIPIDTKTATFKRGGKVYTPVVAGTSITQAASYVAPEVKGNFPLAEGMSLDKLAALSGQPMVLSCDSGQTYTMNGAFFTQDQSVKAGPGSNVSGMWSGQPMLEVVGAA